MNNQNRRERGARAKRVRKAAGLSQSEMAVLLGCSRQLVGALERGGNMSVDQLQAYCIHGKCTPGYIVFGSEDGPAEAELTGDAVASEFAKLSPSLRARLWMLYQVFVRPGVAEPAGQPR
jgi:transcriptional regulator with XRE-family HTH domain